VGGKQEVLRCPAVPWKSRDPEVRSCCFTSDTFDQRSVKTFARGHRSILVRVRKAERKPVTVQKTGGIYLPFLLNKDTGKYFELRAGLRRAVRGGSGVTDEDTQGMTASLCAFEVQTQQVQELVLFQQDAVDPSDLASTVELSRREGHAQGEPGVRLRTGIEQPAAELECENFHPVPGPRRDTDADARAS
jgi:hypothetical protein